MRPLDDIQVVALEQAIAAPYCSRLLADDGARVIKIERPDGGDFARGYDQRARGLSSHFVWTNRGKQSLALDLKRPAARPVVETLLAGTDVLVQNLAPGAAARLGLSFAQLHERFPRLIVCDISGYGEGGPCGDKKAYDLLIQAESGFLAISGEGERAAKAGCSIADIAAGVSAYNGVLRALIGRGRSGRGSRVEVSMLEAMVEWMGFPLYYTLDSAPAPPRRGAEHATIYPYGPFATGDGCVLLGVQNEREWALFCTHILGQPGLVEDPRFTGNAQRHANRAALRALIEAALAPLDAATAVARLEAAGIACAQLRDMADVWAHPQLAARGRWCELDSPVGRLPSWLPPGHDSLPTDLAVPALGEHNALLFEELGVDATTRAALG